MSYSAYRRRVLLISASAAVTLGALTLAGTASAQVVVLAPPAGVYQPAPPPPPPGGAWRPGYWGWAHGRYVWVPAREIAVAPAQAVVEESPPEQAPVQQVMRISADALFPFDRGDVADMRPEGRADIHEIATRLQNTRFERIEVRGYTDPLGSQSYNLELSRRRADAVKAQLVAEGIPGDRIDAVGLGEQDPIAHCDNNQGQQSLVSCLQPDRRVEIVTHARVEQRGTY
ncbi:OmpA family protein [Paraburkholderia sp. BCC1886]|uniref:OmpA family protein n=1 Tax=Paraburkholderia sp. BCC1886 TaxID=2562670 RepID=UPI0011825C79|nr:OmpA family protein [Paraburkholderia sp. BCC1886]